MSLIPTTHRGKISRQLCYPVGAEMISEALRGVPHFERLSLWFRAADRDSLGTPAKLCAAAKRDEPLPVLKASYITSSRLYGEERWRLEVYAVPREDRAAVRRALMDEGLPQVRAWLSAFADSDFRRGSRSTRFPRRGSKHCKVAVRPGSGAVTLEHINVTAG